MCIIAQRLGKPVPAVYYTKRDSKCTIEGRECKQRDTYTFRISNKSVKGYYRGRYVCRKLYQPTESDQYETVYNLSIEEDESYIANGAIVHNCQDISVAGKQLGFQGNRSSLFFRVMYLIGQLEEENKPTYLFIENVKNLLSVNGGWDFARLLIEMDRGGTMRNGKCSTLRTSEFHKTEKGASLSDILEDEVSQKYFLSREQTEKIVFQ